MKYKKKKSDNSSICITMLNLQTATTPIFQTQILKFEKN